MEENKVVFMSIKEEHILRIVNKTKNHEFRNKIPKDSFRFIIVYVPVPVKQIKYILEVSTPVKKLQKINEDGIGNKKFNDGNGTELDTLGYYFDNSVEEAGELRSGASYTKYFYLLYDGNGTYAIEFDSWTEKITVEFEINK